jgi:hypothetical protein
MIDVAIFHGIAEHDFWAESADLSHQGQLVLGVILEKSVFELHVFPNGQAKDLRSPGGFPIPDFRGSPCSQFPPGQVYDPNLFTAGDFLCNRCAGAKLSIIGVCTKYQ